MIVSFEFTLIQYRLEIILIYNYGEKKKMFEYLTDMKQKVKLEFTEEVKLEFPTGPE